MIGATKAIDLALWGVVAAFALGAFGWVGKKAYDSRQLAEIRAVDKKIDAANDKSNQAAEKRDAQKAAYFKRNAKETERVAKELTNAKTASDPGALDRALREHHRVLNDALRGPVQ